MSLGLRFLICKLETEIPLSQVVHVKTEVRVWHMVSNECMVAIVILEERVGGREVTFIGSPFYAKHCSWY